MKSLQDQIIVFTGANSGLGKINAIHCLNKGTNTKIEPLYPIT